MFEPVGWEDTLGGIGRPQEIINEDLRSCDYFLMLLWDGWGTNPQKSQKKYRSSTEEEFSVATQCFIDEAYPMRQVVILFKAVDARRLSDPGETAKSA